MAKHSFPITYDNPDVGCTLVPINNALIPLISGMLRDMLRENYWLTIADYDRGYSAISEVIRDMANTCFQELLDSNLQIIALLQQIAANSSNQFDYSLRSLCCDLALPEPLADNASRPSDDYMCRGLQLIADALSSVADDLWRYASENRYTDATGVALVANQTLAQWSIPPISAQTASELASRLRDVGGIASPSEYMTSETKMNMVMAVFDAPDPQVARNSYISWANGMDGAPQEIQQFFAVLGRDMALWNGLFAQAYTATDYDGSVCGGEPPIDEQVLSSVEGIIVDTTDMSEIDGYRHFYLEVAGGIAPYIASHSWRYESGFATRRMYRVASYAGGLNNPPIFGYFDTDWQDVQLKINDGNDDISVVFYPSEGKSPIALSKTEYTTLPANTVNFIVYSPSDDHAPYSPFSLLAIFP